MKKFFSITICILAAFLFLSSSAWAIIYTIEDTWHYFPGYPDTTVVDEIYGDYIGTPLVGDTYITVNDDTKKLETIAIQVESRQEWDSLFLNLDWDKDNEEWDSWDYMIRDATGSHTDFPGYLADAGVYSVKADYEYTLVPVTNGIFDRRDGNPNGINEEDLSFFNNDVNVTWMNDLLVYDFSNVNFIVGDNFYFAYAPWCANDVTGGSAPVPEPATIILMGFGLIGLAGTARKKFIK